MFTFLMTIHIIVCIFLIAVILFQAGRGGGLSETFGGAAESIFGTRTNAFLTRATAIFATMFILTCVGLTVLSVHKSRSLMETVPLKEKEVVTQEKKAEEKTQPQTSASEKEKDADNPPETQTREEGEKEE